MDIKVLDLCFQGIAHCVASFLVDSGSTKVLIECGPESSRPALVAALAELGIQPTQIDAILLTHIHLDHAGCAGWWAQQGSKIYVHEQGAPHLIDPSKLLASATRIYGEHMDRLWGAVLACPADKVVPICGNPLLRVGDLEFQVWDTPGHARHHCAFQLGSNLFCGDVAAVRLPYQGGRVLSVPAPPPEFDKEQWLQSLDQLEKLPVEWLYLTHFGRHSAVGHFQELRQALGDITEHIGGRRHQSRDSVVEEYLQWTRGRWQTDAQTFEAYEKANPLFMSVDGVLRYWARKDKELAAKS